MAQDEEIISNISYTASDFRSIYPQLLDTAKKLSNKWDPSLSNESDPGNILIKEAAIIGDKNNYHIDKSVLECFPLSATQQSSARQLYDLVGYKMHWYDSAQADVTFKLLKSVETINSENDTNLEFISIPAGTQLTDNSGEHLYTTLSPINLQFINTPQTCSAIEGTIVRYEINSSYTITLDNLDENLRIYFPTNVIAENGIFVCDNNVDVASVGYVNNTSTNSSFWQLVSNVAQHKVGSKVFSFGLDLDTDSCYIQFPDDIIASELIGSGLNIYYVTTAGSNGTVSTGVLNKFNSDVVCIDQSNNSAVINTYINLSNKASTKGKDPESLQSAYKNYKKLIGTYDTLVTRRDYDNAIYNLNKEANIPLVSASLVSDRTTDVNLSQKVICRNSFGNYRKAFVKKDADQVDLLQPYDIVMYLLKSSDTMQTVDDYNNTFQPDLTPDTKNNINNDIEDIKSVQHNLFYITDKLSGIDCNFIIKNLVRLTGSLTTYYRINKADAVKIQNNVIAKLIETYNSRAIDFGNSFDYDQLVATIKSADDRIRNVSLNIPEYNPVMLTVNESGGTTSSSDISLYIDDTTTTLEDLTALNLNNEILARSILNGNVQLFSFNNEFQLDFGQGNSKEYKNIESISTSNNISLPSGVIKSNDLVLTSANAYQLYPNDLVQLIAPNLLTTETFEATVKFAANFTCEANKVYKLTGDNKIKFVYVENTINKAKVYGAGTTIRLNNISISTPNTNTDWTDTPAFIGDKDAYSLLRSGNSVDILELSSITIGSGTRYYLISNTKDAAGKYTKTLTANTPLILLENEYLIYTDETATGFIILGSGTTLISDQTITLTSPENSIETILATDMSDVYTIWSSIPNLVTINATENTIINLAEGDFVAPLSGESVSQLTNSLASATIGFAYQLSDETKASYIEIENISGYYLYARSNMILSANSLNNQLLVGTQSVTVTPDTNSYGSLSAGDNILFNYPVNMVGGDNIDVSILNESTGAYEYSLCLYTYEDASGSFNSSDREDGLLTIDANSSKSLTFNFTDKQNYYMIPISYFKDTSQTITLSLSETLALDDSDSHSYIDLFSELMKPTHALGQSITLAENNAETFTVIGIKVNSNSGCTLSITFSNSSDDVSKVNLGYIKQTSGINSAEIDSKEVANGEYFNYSIETNLSDVIDLMSTLPGYSEYDWSYEVPGSDKILQPLSGKSYFNSSHIYNKCTLPVIDFNTTQIKVNPSSIE